MANKSYNLIIVTIILIILAVFMIVCSPKDTFNSKDYHIEKYTIHSGDTLWTIGKECNGDSADIREWVYAVKDLNNISSNIYPGQSINVYVLN